MVHPASATVSVDGRDGLLAAISTSLGFHPPDSVVIVGLAGPRRRVGSVIRADLTTTPSTAEASPVVAILAAMIAPFADSTVLVIHTNHPDELDLKTAA